MLSNSALIWFCRASEPNFIVSNFLLQFVHGSVVFTEQGKELPGRQTKAFQQRLEYTAGGCAVVGFNAGEGWCGADAIAEVFLGLALVQPLLPDVWAYQHFFHDIFCFLYLFFRSLPFYVIMAHILTDVKARNLPFGVNLNFPQTA